MLSICLLIGLSRWVFSGDQALLDQVNAVNWAGNSKNSRPVSQWLRDFWLAMSLEGMLKSTMWLQQAL